MWKKMLFGIMGLLVLIVGGGIAWLYVGLPDVGPPPDISVEGTTEQVERGRYLAHHVSICMDCHSQRDWSRFSGPIADGTMGAGGQIFSREFGFPGTFYSRNITPHNLGDWSDGEIYRLITTGVTREGEPIFPVMPYQGYGHMDPEDVRSIIAYLRTLEPKANDVPASEPDFPMNLIMRTIPQPAQPMERPAPADSAAYGEYLVTIAGCQDCHTPVQQGSFIDSLFMAGGRTFEMPFGTVRSANITPHPETGIGRWDRQQFVSRFKQYDMPADSLPEVEEGAFNTLMPWQMYAGMSEGDLEAIYTYLRSIEPVANEVTRFTPPSGEMTASSGN